MTFDKSPQKIQAMFNLISDRYDFINRVMSFGTQQYVKYMSIKNLRIKAHDKVIDLCCGTDITGVDFSDKMLEIARSKSKNIEYLQVDVTNLPFADNTFDFAVMGFGLRNIQNAEKAVEEVYRILKPGGYYMHLDFGRKNLLSKIFDFIIPVLVRLFTDNYFAYSYLIKSKQLFPAPDDLIRDFGKKGFKLKKRKDFLFGVISMQIMIK